MENYSYLKDFEKDARLSRKTIEHFYDPDLPKITEYNYQPLKWWFNHWAKTCPDKPYIITGKYSFSYKYCNNIAIRLANALTGLGVKKGDRVAILSPNTPHYLWAEQAIWKIGAIEAPANPFYTKFELKDQFNAVGVKIIIVMASFAPKVIDLMKDPESSIEKIITFQLSCNKVNLPVYDTLYDMNTLIESASCQEPDIETGMEDTVRLQFTGGTTGSPKGCILSNKNVYTMAQRTVLWTTGNFKIVKKEEVRTLAAIPLYHIYGFNMNIGLCLVTGGTIVLVPEPKPGLLLKEILKNRPSIWAAVPAMLIGLINEPSITHHEADITCLKAIFCGSASCPAAVMECFENLSGATVIEGYGMSESSNILTINPMQSRKPGSVGVAIPETDLVVVDIETGTKVMPRGEEGELISRGSQMTKGYWNNPEETKAAIRNGWFYTGDIVVMDEDGYITIRGRKKDMIVVNGFNVFPKEIDDILHRNPKIKEAAAAGVFHKKKGEVPIAYIVLKTGQKMDAEECERYLRKYLAPYKIPIAYRFVETIKRTDVGKIDRKLLSNIFMKENGDLS